MPTVTNEAAVVSPRIPIHIDFFIQIKNGRAITSDGRNPQEAIDRVELWLRKNLCSPNLQTVEEWLLLKRQEVQETEEISRMRAKRSELDARIVKARRKTPKKQRDMIEVIRKAVYDFHGIKPED